MYTAYFGLSEAPFTIAPNPAYLFMSDRHKEALAHLSYGLGGSSSLASNGGFVLLTGEVGTGKTTISRTVMEKLPENTQAAFILNPTLSCEELLACICDNLKIRYKKTGATLKYLTDKIQTKLLKNHHDNINTLLIIDEAQHLQPEVLEQLRLLTNLETNTKKLLQVILIGQPELQQLLQRRDLRQLAQRITARYHLLPLTKVELIEYIKHRLSVAECTRALFNPSAIKALHQISGGIPRIINLLCDRALIIAYGKNESVVNKKIILQASVEALGHVEKNKTPINIMAYRAIAALSLLTICAVGSYHFGSTNGLNSVNMDSEKADDIIEVSKAIVAPELSTHHLSAIEKETGSEIKVKELDLAENIADSKASGVILAMEDVTPNELSKTEKFVRSADKLEKVSVKEKTRISSKPIILGYQAEKYREDNVNKDFDIVAKPGVSPDLLALFKEAVNETQSEREESSHQLEGSAHSTISPENEYQGIHQMSANIQQTLPSLKFDMHIFATEGKGWVRINNQDKKEGDEIAEGVTLIRILPQHVLLHFKEEEFTMPALSSW